MVQDTGDRVALQSVQDLVHDLLGVTRAAAHRCEAQLRNAQHVVLADFSGRHVVPAPRPVQDAANNLALVLQGSGFGDVQADVERADVHGRTVSSAGASRSIWFMAAYSLDDKLVVGISTRALFDLDEAHQLFESQGLEAYTRHQIENAHLPLGPGTGFPLVRGLLRINELVGEQVVEVVVISRNSADTGLRTRHSIKALGLDINRAAFTRGRPVADYLEAFSCDLFLSAHDDDVVRALRAGFAAGKILAVSAASKASEEEVRIAFDGDAVLFSGAGEDLFQREGLHAFQANEAAKCDEPIAEGPFMGFLRALCAIQARFDPERCPIRTALITARDAVSHERVVNTLRALNVRIDEYFFLGGVKKAPIVKAFNPHIFFDDQLAHAGPASEVAPSAQVPRSETE